MKKMFAKQGLTLLLASFFLFGLTVLTATSAGAQDINNWKQSDLAISLLGQEVQNVHQQLPNLSGLPLNNAKAKMYYYKEIIKLTKGGTFVGTSVHSALRIFDTPGITVSDQPTDVVVDTALRQSLLAGAIALVRN